MSLIVEDGTGVVSANVYSTLAEFKAHVPLSGLSLPTATDEVLEAALIRGTAFVEGKYSSRWPGFKSTATQGLAWPRYEAWDDDGFPMIGVPAGVKNACMEAGLVEANTAGVLTEALERGGMLIRKKIGSLEREYAQNAPVATVYPVIKQCLAGIVRGGGGVRLSR